ncbi:uncharacterized protein LOC131023480 [Salvia miltiorrhiza]|uniref:uncharacterized protein LOC131023480 n=1 Tax=Salvia miltiorrhiza TaxID=226208 RepID=UPI0025ACCC83|nr:uncharacterized protein LOC131023480 [Salvia miltiorrhiza]
MESLMRPKIHKYNQKAYGRTKANAPCKKHPKHTQSPGVCSLCLNQKLFRLTNSASSRPKRPANLPYCSSSSSSSSYISSSDESSYSSPVLSYAASRATKSTRLFKNFGQETLKKSRSMAFFLQMRKEEDKKCVEMKRGFWSKLLSTKNKALMHSRTTRERVVAAVQ